MRLPANRDDRDECYRYVRRTCTGNAATRRPFYDRLSHWYLTGSDTIESARHNKLQELIKESVADLYAPGGIMFDVEHPARYGEDFLDEDEAATVELHDIWRRAKAGLEIALAVEWAHVWPGAIVKVYTDRNIPVTDLLPSPADVCVLRPEQKRWDTQEAVVHFYAQDLSAFERRVRYLKDYREIMHEAMRMAAPPQRLGTLPPAYRAILLSATSPDMIGAPYGGVLGPGGLERMVTEPGSREPVVRLSEMWIRDDEVDDYRCVTELLSTERIISDPINPLRFGTPGQHPFHALVLDPLPQTIWGMPPIVGLIRMQVLHEEFLAWIAHVLGIQFNPPFAASGVTGILEERLDVLRQQGGNFAMPMPQSRVENMAPQMPPDAFGFIEALNEAMGRRSGRPPGVLGQTAARSGDQQMAQALLASGPTLNRAMRVEEFVEGVATAMLRLQRAVSAAPLRKSDGQRFLLSQVPGDFHAVVSAHSTSPLLSQQNLEKIFLAAQKDWLDGEMGLKLLGLPMIEKLMARSRRTAKMRAEVATKQMELEEGEVKAKLIKANRP